MSTFIQRLRGFAVLSTLLLLCNFPAQATDFYVAPNGTKTASGTLASPWDLQTALSQPAAVHPGDTIWLRGGRYVGTYRSYLTGTPSSPIKVRPYPGERATLDGNATTTLAAAMDASTTTCALAASLYGPNTVVRIDSEDIYLWDKALIPNRGWNGTTPTPHAAGATVFTNTVALAIDGAYTWFMGFEITNTSGARSNPTTGSLPPDRLGFAIDDNGPGTKVINMVLHDAGQGLGLWVPATDAEAYGNIIYYNGWDASDRGHGHGIYTQNQAPSVHRIVDNVLFDQFAIGIQAYTGGGFIDNVQLEGNVAFDNGVLSQVSGATYNLLVGGMNVANNPSLVSNFTYTAQAAGGNDDLGYNAGCTNATVTGNYFAGASALKVVSCLTGLAMSGNTFYGGTSGFTPSSYPSNSYLSARPTSNLVFVRPNQYEAGRANVVVYNWQLLPSVSVNLSGVLAPGASYEIRNAQNFFAAPVLSGTYAGGSVSVPMTGLTPAAPVGAATPASAGPEFAAFVVLTVAGAPSCSYTLGTSSASVPAAGASGSVSVTAASGCAWTASSNAAWLTVTGGASGTGNGTVSYTAAANVSCAGRSGSLTIAGHTFTVTQTAGTASASISPSSASTSAGAGGGTVAVTNGTGCAWTASSNAAWLTVTSGASGTGNGTVTYAVLANAACAGRSGTLTVAGKTFTVTQAAGTAAATISPTAATTSAGAGGGTISVTVGASCPWTASSGVPWITITAGASGTGGGTVTYTIAANGACARTGTLIVAGQTFSVSQSASGSCSAGFFPLAPCRVVDTRKTAGPLGGPSMSAGASRAFPVMSSTCGIPASAKSVSVTVTAVKPTADGILHAYPGNLAPSSASILSFRKGRTRSASALLLLATDATGRLAFQNESAGSLDLVVDVSGYFQ